MGRSRIARLLFTLLALAAGPLAAQDPLRTRFTVQLNDLGGYEEWTDRRRQHALLWNTLDSMVVRELNRGRAADEVNRALAALPGYRSAAPGAGFTLGRAVFYSELPRETPNFFVAPVRASRETVLLGVRSFGYNDPGRVSVYAWRAGRWRTTGRFDTRFPAEVFLLPLADSALALVAMEVFTGGDHQDGRVRVWSLRNGALALLDTVAGEMKDPSAKGSPRSVEIHFTRYPEHLVAPILGTRLEYRLTIAPAGSRVRMSRAEANPWVHVVERYFGLVKRGRPAEARALLAEPSLAAKLGREAPGSREDGGDLRTGRGHVVIATDAGGWRVESRRDASGRWRITSATPTADPWAKR